MISMLPILHDYESFLDFQNELLQLFRLEDFL